MRIRWRRASTATIVLGGFTLYLASIVAGWVIPLWLYLAGPAGALCAISLLSIHPRRSWPRSDLYASDAYSDAYLGRAQPTHPHHDPRPTSQIGPGLPPDPLHVLSK
jgi:hypothetical protein